MSLGHTIALAAAPILAVAKVSTGVIIAKSVALGTLAAGAIAVIRNRREFGRIAQMDAAQLRDIGLTPADIYDAERLPLTRARPWPWRAWSTSVGRAFAMPRPPGNNAVTSRTGSGCRSPDPPAVATGPGNAGCSPGPNRFLSGLFSSLLE
jgi:uncharacterized protein YjiS (DUF1127 family)